MNVNIPLVFEFHKSKSNAIGTVLHFAKLDAAILVEDVLDIALPAIWRQVPQIQTIALSMTSHRCTPLSKAEYQNNNGEKRKKFPFILEEKVKRRSSAPLFLCKLLGGTQKIKCVFK